MSAWPGTHRIAGLSAALILFVADQAAKWFVTHSLALPADPDRTIEVTSFFALRWVENRGVSMGFLTAGTELERWLLVALTAAIVVGVGVWLWRERARADAIALGCVMGGAIGNILDRVRLGYVVDFADLHLGGWHPFLVFNVGDAAITVGVLLLVLRALLTRDAPKTAETFNA